MAESKSAVAIVARRAVIETNIERCRDAAAENIVEIGRWLNRAKEENIVPHGEWTAWVTQHAGMNERTAQRAMQFARELPEGSALARLGVAKITSLLTLPAAEREEVAQRISAEKISSREVDEQVKAIRAERDEAYRVMGEQRKKSTEQAERIDAMRKELIRQEDTIHGMTVERRNKNSEIEQLRAELEKARQTVQVRADPEQDRRIRLLESQLKEKQSELMRKELEIDRLSDQLDEAQTAAMRGGMNGEERISASTRILCAIGAFMTQGGTAVGELERTIGMIDEESKVLLIGQATLLGQLAMRVIAACGGDADGIF